jgi:hypothetical protein
VTSDPFARFRQMTPGTRVPFSPKEAARAQSTMFALRSRWPESVWWKVPQSGFSLSGIADILGCHTVGGIGVFVAIEMKRADRFDSPARGMTMVQVRYGKQVLLAGGIWGVARDQKMALDIIERGLDADYRAYASAELLRIEKAIETRRARENRRKKASLERAEELVRKRMRFRFKPRKYRIPIDLATGMLIRSEEA